MEEPKEKKIKIESQKSISKDESVPKVSKSIKDSTNNSDLSESLETESSNLDSWDPQSTCWGCREGQPNQQAHMERGGCLYYDSDLDSENEKE